MAAPQVTWTNSAGTTQNSWAIGTVDIGTTSADTTFLVWNNKGGAGVVSDMTNVTITTKDSNGGDTGTELVTNKWIEVKCVSMSESTFTPIGGQTTKAIKASGASVAAGTISGATNDGTYNNAKNNFSEIVLHAKVPTVVNTSGSINFFVRVAYQYT